MLNDLIATLPLGILAVMGCFVLLVDVFSEKGGDRRYLGYLSAGGMALALLATYMLYGRTWGGFESPQFWNMMAMGQFELLSCGVLLLIGLVVCLLCVDHAEDHGFAYGELYALIIFAVFGMMVLVTATNLVTLFVGLEIMSISIYVLAAIKRTSAFSAEAGLKYFVLGAFSSGLLLYGMAFLYGDTGSLSYAGMAAVLSSGAPTDYMDFALFLLVAAFGFKIAAVPFHMWTPDVYEGAPPPITGLMAAGVKTAAVIAMARLFAIALPESVLQWVGNDLFDVLAALAIVTMTLGNLVAIQQRNLKRMLAFSSIAHAGYLLIGVMAVYVAADPAAGTQGAAMGGVLFYLFVYALANLACFAVVTMIAQGEQEEVTLDHVSGMAMKSPMAALVLALGMLSLAGIPPTAGFFGKFALFSDALAVDPDRFLWLVVIAMLNSVISVYYYLRVVVYAYMRDAVREVKKVRGFALAAAFVICGLGTLQVGLFPGRYIGAVDTATADLQVRVAKEITRERERRAAPAAKVADRR